MSDNKNQVTRYFTGKAAGNLGRWVGIALAIVLFVVGCGVISGLVTLSAVPQGVVVTEKPPVLPTYTPYPTYTPVPTMTAVPNQALLGGVVHTMSEVPAYATASKSPFTDRCGGSDWSIAIDQVYEDTTGHSTCWNIAGVPYLVYWNFADVPGIGGGAAEATPTQQFSTAVPNQAVTGTFALGWTTNWYRSPFRDTTKQLVDAATFETFAEPGMFVEDNAQDFKKMSDATTVANAPEGGYLYMSIGSATISYNGASLLLPAMDDLAYNVVVRGLPADGTDVDLNKAITISDYPRGMGTYALIPAGAYVSLDWTIDQIKNLGKPVNCGDNGCKLVIVVVIDIESMTYRSWATTPSNPTIWTRAS